MQERGRRSGVSDAIRRKARGAVDAPLRPSDTQASRAEQSPPVLRCDPPICSVPTASVRPHRLLVGVSLDAASALALRRAHALSRILELELRVVHVIGATVGEDGRRQERGNVRDLASRRTRLRLAKRGVQEWAQFATGITLPSSSIHVRVGIPADELCGAARRFHVALLVLGGAAVAGAKAPGTLTRTVLSRAACPVLVCGAARAEGAFIVATDLSHPSVPVVRAAASLARRLGRSLSVVHNVDAIATDGAALPLPPSVQDQVLVERLDALAGIVRAIAPVRDATLTREPLAAEGILRVARERDVDLIVVGARREAGLTAESILSDTRRSLLSVPLPPHAALEG